MKVDIKYYGTRCGGKYGYWLPCLKRGGKPTLMAELGFKAVACGRDGPAAWAIAEAWNARWQEALAAHHRGEDDRAPASIEAPYPDGSLGAAFTRYRATHAWAQKKPRTQEDWERGWKYIGPVFGVDPPKATTFEEIDQWYAAMLEKHGVREAHRAMKIWRALWVVVTAMGYCAKGDPSLGIRRKTPVPRQAIWYEGEAVRLVKRAWRMGYLGLAAALAVAWDTMLSPVDVRRLTRAQIAGDEFAVARAKTGKAAIGTLGRRARRILVAYAATLPEGLHPSAPIFYTRGGLPGPKGGRPRPPVPYTADTLGDDFREVRRAEFGMDEHRTIMDFRRSGAVEATAGEVSQSALAGKMANSIDANKELQSTYQPATAQLVRLADAARTRGRARMRDGRGGK